MTLYSLLENMINKIRNNASQTEVQSAELIRLESKINNVHNTVYPNDAVAIALNCTLLLE